MDKLVNYHFGQFIEFSYNKFSLKNRQYRLTGCIAMYRDTLYRLPCIVIRIVSPEFHQYTSLVFVMGPKKAAAAETDTPGTKRSRPQDSPEASSPHKDVLDLLQSIDKRLLGFEGRLHLLEVLHKEFQDLRTSLEFSQERVERLAAENASLRESVSSLTAELDRISQDNNALKETVLDLQSRSMRDNLVFAGLPEQTGGEAEDCEQTIKNFLHTHMKIPEETVKNITFHRVHRHGARRTDSRRPHPIVATFEHFNNNNNNNNIIIHFISKRLSGHPRSLYRKHVIKYNKTIIKPKEEKTKRETVQ
nr:uncharacterized protein LOC129152519 [Nothobranchius furzeri]